MKLDKYLSSNEITTQRFALMLGASYSAVSKWRIGIREPKIGWVLKIAKVTGNKVSVTDWKRSRHERRVG